MFSILSSISHLLALSNDGSRQYWRMPASNDVNALLKRKTRSKYRPHQGQQEIARRLRQLERNAVRKLACADRLQKAMRALLTDACKAFEDCQRGSTASYKTAHYKALADAINSTRSA